LVPLKTVFHIFIFLAVTAFTVDAIAVFVAKNAVETCSDLVDPDEEPDTDEPDPCDSDGEEEEGETPVKELFLEGFAAYTFELVAPEDRDFFGEIKDSSGSHLIAPPYSPPELL
jgi:hypothetical protein